jgi:hypothetical protein
MRISIALGRVNTAPSVHARRGTPFDLHDPAAVLQCVAARRHSVLYYVEHGPNVVDRKQRRWTSNMALFTSAVPNCADKWELLKEKRKNRGKSVVLMAAMIRRWTEWFV